MSSFDRLFFNKRVVVCQPLDAHSGDSFSIWRELLCIRSDFSVITPGEVHAPQNGELLKTPPESPKKCIEFSFNFSDNYTYIRICMCIYMYIDMYISVSMYVCMYDWHIFFFTSLMTFFFPFLWKPPVSLVIYSKRALIGPEVIQRLETPNNLSHNYHPQGGKKFIKKTHV